VLLKPNRLWTTKSGWEEKHEKWKDHNFDEKGCELFECTVFSGGDGRN
jgi:hypothetical protein